MIGQVALGLGLALAGWIIPRWVAAARRVSVATPLDGLPLAFVALVLAVAGGLAMSYGVLRRVEAVSRASRADHGG